ncbi:MAG: LytTR family DNA-binding domain-containing protein [Lachnospiraceae bacterium]|nr:LytTR family DNA-binding domain-containing protein [Lachnospiraceae bacterium]
MLRIGICDDQIDARDSLRFQLEKVIREESEQIVYEFSTGESAARWLKKHPGEIDLLFLDVEMKGMNGMEAAGQIREFDKNICLVFVTGYTDYVFDGYKVNALDYVIKPVGAERLAEVLRRVRKQVFDGREKFFSFKNAEGTYRLPLADISYFYSEKRKVNVVCAGRGEQPAYAFYGKLDEVERRLSDAFVRVHQRYLVNPGRVTRIGGESVTADGQNIPVSRAMKEGALVKLAKAMLEGEEQWASGNM